MFEGLGDEGPPLLRVFRPGLEVVEFPRRCLTQALNGPEF
jgi:hypothetical protein